MWVRGALAGEGAALFVKEGPAGGAALGSLIPKRLTGFRYKLGPSPTCLEPRRVRKAPRRKNESRDLLRAYCVPRTSSRHTDTLT